MYWTTGNPFPATDGDDRKGLNLYTNCVLALEAKTGKLRWYYQFTPHDLHDWDATETLLLVDTKYRGRDRNSLEIADPGGKSLHLAEPFVDLLKAVADLLEEFPQSRLEGALELLVHRKPCLPRPPSQMRYLNLRFV